MSSAAKPARAAALPPEQRRASIIDATTALLREHGRDITTRQIADAAGIAEGTIFRVFDTKDDLIDAAVDEVMDLTETIARLRGLDLRAPLADRMAACAGILTERLDSVVEIMVAIHRKPSGQPPHRPRSGPRRNERHAEVLAAVASVLQPDADRLSMPPERAAHVLWLLVFGGTHRMISDGRPLGPGDITDLLLHGILRPTESPPAPSPAPDPTSPRSGNEDH